MSLLSRFRHVLTPVPVERGMPWPIDFLTFGGMSYPLMGLNQTMPNAKQEDIDGSFRSFASAYRSNAIVFAVMNARMRLFTEARFQFRTMRNGKPGDLFGTADLAILETPWTNATTGDLLARMIADADLAGNFYGIRRPGPSLQRLQPDWVSILVGGTSNGLDAHIAGYAYQPGGPSGGQDRIVLLPEEVCHFAPIPDPMARYRGMSWLSPIVRELQADNAATAHKLSFFENGATPNLVVKRPDEVSKEMFEKWVAAHGGGARRRGERLQDAVSDQRSGCHGRRGEPPPARLQEHARCRRDAHRRRRRGATDHRRAVRGSRRCDLLQLWTGSPGVL